MTSKRVLFYYPNLIGYARLFVSIYAFLFVDENPDRFLTLYISCILLDVLDGIVARLANQCSEFGAWLDVLLDNFLRGAMWARVTPTLATWITGWEWLCFLCLHSMPGLHWKTVSAAHPWWVSKVLRNNFRTVTGVLVLSSLNFLAVVLYMLQLMERRSVAVAETRMTATDSWLVDFWSQPAARLVLQAGACIMTVGRLYGACVEAWFVHFHILQLLAGKAVTAAEPTAGPVAPASEPAQNGTERATARNRKAVKALKRCDDSYGSRIKR